MRVCVAVLLGLLFVPALCVYNWEEAHGLSDFLRAGDYRLVRDRPHDGSYQRTGVFCDVLDALILTLRDSPDDQIKHSAADAIATCLIHRPENQDVAGVNPDFHEAVVDYLREEPHMAAQIIWAAVENNHLNLEGFIVFGAIGELFRVMQYYENSVASMWAAAALMNMATSYCGLSTGPCQWRRDETGNLQPLGEIEVDGLAARLHIIGLEGIWDLLLDQVCSSAAFEDVEGIIFPSKARIPVDGIGLSPWAVAGLIKALALRKSSHDELEATVPCLCILSKSDDPLERRNAWEALNNLDRDGACHSEDPRLGVCIDMPFETLDRIRCSDFNSAADCVKYSKDEAGLSSKEACCICGGGDQMANTFSAATKL
jgi:hypothetical protein